MQSEMALDRLRLIHQLGRGFEVGGARGSSCPLRLMKCHLPAGGTETRFLPLGRIPMCHHPVDFGGCDDPTGGEDFVAVLVDGQGEVEKGARQEVTVLRPLA